MSDGPRGGGWLGRKRWAWVLYAAAMVAMTVGLFLPSYGVSMGWKSVHGGPVGMQSYPGWECAWTVVWIWGALFDGSLSGIDYGESLMLSYLPINALFLLAPLFLWLEGRTRRLRWVFRIVYTLIVVQVFAWWVLHVFDHGRSEEILIGYWFWLAAYMLLAAAFWVMQPGGALDRADPEVRAPERAPS